MEYDDSNSGALFKNDKGDNPNRPDYKGTINVNGKAHWLSAWLKTSKAGKNYMSLEVQPKDEQAAPAAASSGGGSDTDDIPFAAHQEL